MRLALAIFALVASQAAWSKSAIDIFPAEGRHNHGSCIVECPNGDLLACWYRGSGERRADDCEIVGARLTKGSKKWSKVFSMADTPDLPDTNPCMMVDSRKRLHLYWPTILDNNWESALLKVRSATDFGKGDTAPKFSAAEVIHLKPGTDFSAIVHRELDPAWAPVVRAASSSGAGLLSAARAKLLARADDKLSTRLGWMPRVHPTELPDGRILLPLYSDGFDFSLIAFSDNAGKSWKCSAPIVGAGNVQPSIVRRKNGDLVAYFRDNGREPARVIVSLSLDRGETWSRPADTEVTDTGAGVEAIVLRSGRWLLVNNDTHFGRHRLAISISDNEGASWPLVYYVENSAPGKGSFSYPSFIQSRNGQIHLTYSAGGQGTGETIRHVTLAEEEIVSSAVPRIPLKLGAESIVASEFVYERAPFPSCHASTIATNGSEVLAAWFGGTAESNPDVGIWFARRGAAGWSAPVELANGIEPDGKRYPCWNPVLFQAPAGPLLLFYKVGPNPRQWWGMVIRSTDGGGTWSKPTRLPDGILGPIKNKPIITATGDLLSPSSTEHDGWRTHTEWSSDLGATWQKSHVINKGDDFGIIQPSFLTLADGRLRMLCRSRQGVAVQSDSSDGGKTWSTPVRTPLLNPNSGLDAVTLKDGRHLLVYNPVKAGRTPLRVALSTDGTNWHDVVTLEDEPGEYSYPAIHEAADGVVHITYTWKRLKVRYVTLDTRRLVVVD